MTFFASQERVHINTYLQHKIEINRNMTQDDNLRYPKTLWVDGEILTHATQSFTRQLELIRSTDYLHVGINTEKGEAKKKGKKICTQEYRRS